MNDDAMNSMAGSRPSVISYTLNGSNGFSTIPVLEQSNKDVDAEGFRIIPDAECTDAGLLPVNLASRLTVTCPMTV